MQQQLLQSYEQISSLSQEIAGAKGELATAIQQVNCLNQDRTQKDVKLRELEQAVVSLVAAGGQGGQSGGRKATVSLLNLKTMEPKVFDGKVEGNFRNWAKKVTAYCNGSRPGFKQFLQWMEKQEAPINPAHMPEINWEYKEAANQELYDFLMMRTADAAQTVVELSEDNGLEAWRQLVRRFDPIGESYVLDQMGSLMNVEQCAKLADLPGAIARWEKSHNMYMRRTGKTGVPEEWRIPLLMKMVPKSHAHEIQVRHKFATAEEKTYDRFSRMLIEMAGERIYEFNRSRGKDDMDVDPVDPDDEPEYNEKEWEEWTAQCQTEIEEELNWLGAKGKGKGNKGNKGKGKGKPSTGKGGPSFEGNCLWCHKYGHQKKDCREFDAWKKKKDEERAKRGEAPFVPKTKAPGLGSFEPEGPTQSDYVAAGMLDGDDSDPGCNMVDPDDDDDDGSGNEDRGDFQIVTQVKTQKQKRTARNSPLTATSPSTGLFMPVKKTAAAGDADHGGGSSSSAAPAPPRPLSWDLKSSPAMSNVSSESITDRVCREIEEMKNRLEKANRVDGERLKEGITEVTKGIPFTPRGLGKKPTGSMSVFRAMMDKSVESIDTGSYDSPVEADRKSAEYFGINSPARDCNSIGTQTDFTFATSLDGICWKPEIAERQEDIVEGEDAKLSLAVTRQEQDLANYVAVPSDDESKGDYDESEEEMQEDGSSSSSRGDSGELADIADGKVAERIESIEKGLPPPPTISLDGQARPRRRIVRRVGASRTTFALGHSSQCETGCGCETAVEEMVEDLGYAELMIADAERAKKPQKTESGGKGKMRLRRGITMDTGAHHNVMPKRMAGHLKVRSSPGSRIGMSYV